MNVIYDSTKAWRPYHVMLGNSISCHVTLDRLEIHKELRDCGGSDEMAMRLRLSATIATKAIRKMLASV